MKEEGQSFHKLHVLVMSGDLWDKVRGLCSEAWKGGVSDRASSVSDTP